MAIEGEGEGPGLNPSREQTPGLQELLVTPGSRNPNIVMQLLTGSAQPHEYLLRSRLTRSEINDQLEMHSMIMEVYTGYVDHEALMAWMANALGGMDGKARQEVVTVLTRSWSEPNQRGANGVLRRARSPDGSQDAG